MIPDAAALSRSTGTKFVDPQSEHVAVMKTIKNYQKIHNKLKSILLNAIAYDIITIC